MPARHVAAAAVALATLGSLGACSKDPATSTAQTYTVKAGDKSCDVEQTTFAPGPITFSVDNTASDVTEVYVYGKSGDSFTEVIEEAEDIGPGTSRDLTVDLDAGSYRLTCKPGMVGSGISVPIVVRDNPS
ncbi:MAG: cupredoxin domain-containing protein [Propionibacteriales bacterium]|nr:cupredoxin domain-containing protein [Propionibacteriales bacterium]